MPVTTTIDDDVEPMPDYEYCCRHTSYRVTFASEYLIELKWGRVNVWWPQRNGKEKASQEKFRSNDEYNDVCVKWKRPSCCEFPVFGTTGFSSEKKSCGREMPTKQYISWKSTAHRRWSLLVNITHIFASIQVPAATQLQDQVNHNKSVNVFVIHIRMWSTLFIFN